MTPLVLLPGMMCDARLFSPQIAAFSRERAVQIAPLTNHDTISALAAGILDNAPPKFALAGLSMGGIVAMEVMAQAPDRVDRLCLMDTNALAEPEEFATMREPHIARALGGDLEGLMREALIPNYLADGANHSKIADLCLDMAMGQGSAVFERQSRALQTRPDQTEGLRKITAPTLVLMGEQDKLCPLKLHTHMVDTIEDAQFVSIQGAGHLPTLEAPEATTNALRQWLST